MDRELDSRTAEVAAMSATLIELETHPGLEHVRRYPPTGVTAQRWAVVEKSLAQLWEGLGRMTSILDSVRTVRARRSKLDDDDRAELTRLLRERPLEVSRQRIPLAQRMISGLGEAVESRRARRHGGADARRLPGRRRVPRRGRSDQLAGRRTDSRRRRSDSTAAGAAGSGGDRRAVGDIRDRSTVVDRTTTSSERISAIADSVEQRSAELAELAALQSNWPDALATTGRSI